MSREWSVFLQGQTWIWLGGGLLVTIRVAAVVVAISLVTGTLFRADAPIAVCAAALERRDLY